MHESLWDWWTRKKYTGSITLSHGWHQVFIPLRYTPKDIYLNVNQHVGCVPVCHGDLTLCSAVRTKKGFVLFADVKTSKAKIEWIAYT